MDFLTEKIRYRQQHTSLKKEQLARALGLKGGSHPIIIDATAGLAQDSFILASLGFEVTLLERSPDMYQWVVAGMARAREEVSLAAIIDRMHLIQADAIDWLQQLPKEHRPDKIYVDPMFPERKKSALPKKTMRLLHEVVGGDADADALLQVALRSAKDRVVVKRPRLAKSLVSNREPSFVLMGSSSRFDVYITKE